MSFPLGSILSLLQSGLGVTLCFSIALHFSDQSIYHPVLKRASQQTVNTKWKARICSYFVQQHNFNSGKVPGVPLELTIFVE